jgi:hypothetical protein
MEATNYLDLRDILNGPTTNLAFTEAGSNESGTLTVTDVSRCGSAGSEFAACRR